MLETLGEAITIREAGGTLVYANRAALRHLGFETVDELQRRPLESLLDDYIVHDELGRLVTTSDLPSIRLLRDDSSEPLLMRAVNRRTGETRWELSKTAGLRDANGRLIAAVTVIEDLTAVKTAEVHMRMLSELGRTLGFSFHSPQALLQDVVEVAVPGLADWCAVDLVDQEMRREHGAIAGGDPTRREVVARLRESEPVALDPRSTIGRVILTGDSKLFSELTDEHLVECARDPAHLELLRALEIRSAIVVAMRVRSRTVGTMTFCTSESRRRLTRRELEFAEQFAGRVAIALENSRLQQTLSRVAETLQQSLMPNDPPQVPGWEIAALYRPAGATRRIEVGGDFYEVFAGDSESLALIGDVTGHGVTAATLAALLRYGARFASRLEPQPAAILHGLDEELRQQPGTALCTALCARLSTGEVVLSSGGHPAALLVDVDGNVIEAPATGPLLGAFADARWDEETLSVAPGTLVLLYTDGITETAGTHERFGVGRLRRLLMEHAGASPSELLDALEATLDGFRHGEPSDDVAALALRRTPADA